MAAPRGLGWWVGGTLVAFSGVGLVRLVAPRAGALAVPAYLSGFTLAILGLRNVREKIRPTTALRVRHAAGVVLILIGVALALKMVAVELL